MNSDRHILFPDFAAGGRLIAVGVAMLLLAAGCHTSRKAVEVQEQPPEEEVVEVVAPKRTYTVLNFEGTVEGVNVSGQLRVAEDSVMWVSVYKIIEMGRAMCTPDSLWLHAPFLGREEALDYPALRRQTGVDITYDEMQQTALAPDAEERLTRLAQRLGVRAKVRITQHRQVESLSFPYTKPSKP